MNVVKHAGVGEWLADVSELLYRHEAEHSLMLGLAEQFLTGTGPVPEQVSAWSVHAQGLPIGAAFSTSQNLIVSRMPGEAARELVESLAKAGAQFPGVVGSSASATAFAEGWSRATGGRAVLRMSQFVQDCSAVRWHERAAGQFREAEIADLSVLAEWCAAFQRDVLGEEPTEDPEPGVRHKVESRTLFVWEAAGEIVSSASIGRPTRSSVTVNYVYTPPEYRGHGYATSCVAEVSSRQLRAGRRFCCLYTDASNPISNAVYARIGYRKVRDSAWWKFED